MNKSEEDLCQDVQLHPDIISYTAERMAPEDSFREISEILKVMGDSNRLRILYALNTSELCVCDLTELLGLSQSAVSHQLRLLRTSRLVKFRKEGKNVYYSLDENHLKPLLELALQYIQGAGT